MIGVGSEEEARGARGRRTGQRMADSKKRKVSTHEFSIYPRKFLIPANVFPYKCKGYDFRLGHVINNSTEGAYCFISK